MFKISKDNVNVIESDKGFSVEVLGITGLKYNENDKSYFIDSEVLNGPSGLIVFRNRIKEWGENSNASLNEKKRAEIIENVKSAFKFKGYKIKVS